MDLFHLHRLPLLMHPGIAFLTSWALLYLVQRSIPAFKYRRELTQACCYGFGVYWVSFCLNLPLRYWVPPYFGVLGFGDEVLFVLLVFAAFKTFEYADHIAYWEAAFSKRFWVTFTEDGRKLERFPSLAERTAEAEGKPYVPPGS